MFRRVQRALQMQPQRQFIRLSQLAHCLQNDGPVGSAGVAALGGGDAAGRCLAQHRPVGGLAVLHRVHRLQRVQQRNGVVSQNAPLPVDAAAGRLRRLRRDARRLQSRRVAHQNVPAHPVENDRPLRHHRVQLCPGGHHRLIKKILIPAVADERLARGQRVGIQELPAPPGHLRRAFGVKQIHLCEISPRVQQMQVGIVESGHHRGSPQFHHRHTGSLPTQFRTAHTID